ncbi:hypothetical protein L798_08920 [Zootermopsis nevadensis]|uniref:Uncharacterized protein n=1 Tax=Zootermopsis nevadensis TaxID=136037 RepID=A0A067R262_ZOONE|nr:hypothetical protein L798_08920 [Zootermopsis nevadensis]
MRRRGRWMMKWNKKGEYEREEGEGKDEKWMTKRSIRWKTRGGRNERKLMKGKKEKYFLSQFMKCSGKMSLRIKCLIPDGTAMEALVCVCGEICHSTSQKTVEEPGGCSGQ